MKKLFTLVALASLIAVIGLFAFATAQSADAAQKFTVVPQPWVGKAGVCGPDAGHKIVAADWVKGLGMPDGNNKDNQSYGLILSKNGPTSDCSSGTAKINGVKNITLTELGFDIRNGSWCGAGAPRFNVVTADDAMHFLGCAAAAQTPVTPAAGWTRVRMDPAAAYPPIAPDAKVKSIEIIFDEGTDVGNGFAILDNIDINGTLVGR